MALIEAPDVLQQTLKTPDDHIEMCKLTNTPYRGNAAGNTIDLLNLDGANEPEGPLPEGFTPRGIVALTFSIISAFLGLAAITWYGMGELGSGELAAARRRIAESGK
ncbi:MAG: hypothetical protein M1814_000412 [Vezdaea aestivalis]|nr:MAG: hypothetical protein M1814_000412 [Vezdaea aestivalis]